MNPPTSAATILPRHILSFTSHNTIWSRGGAGAVVLSQNLNISVYFYPKIGQNIILDQGDTFPPPHLAKSQSVMDFVMSSLIKYAPIYRHQYISLVGLVLLGFTMTMTECSRCMRLAMITTLHPPLSFLPIHLDFPWSIGSESVCTSRTKLCILFTTSCSNSSAKFCTCSIIQK